MSFGEKVLIIFLCGLVLSVGLIAMISEKKAHIGQRIKKASQPIYIYISGAVEYPGKYDWKKEDSIMDVVKKTMPKREADFSFIPPSQKIKYSFSIFIPCKENF